MAKGSGRRRIAPADGIIYDEEKDITNIEQRGARSKESLKFKGTYADLGAPPTAWYDYGSHSGTGTNGRYSGRGRKNDFRNWKSYTKGKQYEHNLKIAVRGLDGKATHC